MFVFEEFNNDEILMRASSLAYYTALAMAPLIVLFVWTLAVIDPSLQAELVRDTKNLMGDEGSKVIAAIIQGAEDRPDLTSLSGWLGLAGLLVSASVIFAQLQETLNIIFAVDKLKKKSNDTFLQSLKGLFLTRLFSVGMLLTFVFLATISLLVSSVIAYIFRGAEGHMLQIAITVFNLFLFSFLFALIFKWMPDRNVRFRSALIGGVITSVLFAVGKSAIAVYLSKFSVGSAYGAAGSLAVLLAWVFYSAVIFYLGAEVSYAFVVEGPEAASKKPRKNPDHVKKVNYGRS